MCHHSLFATTISQLERVIADEMPEISTMSIKFSAKYLGVLMGPGAHEHFFDEALQKYRDRILRRASQRA